VHRYSWLNVAEAMYAGLREATVALWRELRGIDTLLDEVAAEVDGEDPPRPIMRDVLEQARRDLLHLQEALSDREPLAVPEAGEEDVALAWQYFDNGYRLMASL
jgi:phytoene/squalene synthetase